MGGLALSLCLLVCARARPLWTQAVSQSQRRGMGGLSLSVCSCGRQSVTEETHARSHGLRVHGLCAQGVRHAEAHAGIVLRGRVRVGAWLRACVWVGGGFGGGGADSPRGPQCARFLLAVLCASRARAPTQKHTNVSTSTDTHRQTQIHTDRRQTQIHTDRAVELLHALHTK
jgi:hypothetical protein